MEKVAGIILLVDSIEDSVSFYSQLGFKVTKEVPDTATTMSFNEFWVELLHKRKVVSEEYKEDIGTAEKGAGIYLQVQVKDIDTFYETIISNGVEVSRKPEDYSWNQREFIIIDPDGYKIAFFTPLDLMK